MRTVQEIFDTVIQTGHYGKRKQGVICETYMCFALTNACRHQVITSEESDFAHDLIKDYLTESATLKGALGYNRLPSSSDDRLALYQNWENRPKLGVL